MNIKLPTKDHEASLQYMSRWFWDIDILAQAAGTEPTIVNEMVEANCIPGIIYNHHNKHGWWSALAAHMEKVNAVPPKDGQSWHSPAALWWIRRTLCSMRQGLAMHEAAQLNEDMFIAKFKACLLSIPNANLAYPSCFLQAEKLDNNKANDTARAEWKYWIQGVYGVCLRNFTANTCIQKEALGARIKQYFEDREAYPLSEQQLLELSQELAGYVTPFAPWERRSGTPGKTIDVTLLIFDLGHDYPYPYPHPVYSAR